MPLITSKDAFLKTLIRLREANDNVAFRTSGGLRIMIRNDPSDDNTKDSLDFDVSVVAEEEVPAIAKALRNEVDIIEDECGVIVIEEYSFLESDTENLERALEFLNIVDSWCICPCGEYLIKDTCTMCYYCDLTRNPDDTTGIFCPICHEEGCSRWMIETECCKQKMHRKCKDTCIATAESRLQEARCPMCRTEW